MAKLRVGPGALFTRFSDDWLTSGQACWIFALCSVSSVLITLVLMSHLDIARMPALKRLPIGIVGIVGPAGALFILAGMLRFWYRVDRTRRWAKWFWLVVMLAAFPWGSAVYFLVVYIPQAVRFNRLGV